MSLWRKVRLEAVVARYCVKKVAFSP